MHVIVSSPPIMFLVTFATKDQAPVVQKMDNTIQGINHYPADSMVCSIKLIRWIVIYPMDSVIQPSNNWG